MERRTGFCRSINQEMDSLLSASLWALLSAVFFQFVSTAQVSITAEPGQYLILPCRDSDKGDIVVVKWSRTDLGSDPVLRFRDGHTEIPHEPFRSRLDLQDKQMKDGDVSLVLKNATTKDTGTYECLTVQRGRNPEEKSLNIIYLHVAPPPPPPPPPAQVNITVVAGQDLILPCRDPDNGTIVALEWTRTDQGSDPVLRFRDGHMDKEHPYFGNRLDLQDKQMKEGNVSVVLKNATTKDTGTYECLTIKNGRSPKEKSLNIIDLHVAPPPPPPPHPPPALEPFPSWASALLVLVLVGAAAGLLYHFRHCFMSEYYVKVDSGEESVLMPCRTRPFLPGDARVEWRDRGGRKVHVYDNSSDHPEEQDQFYRNRTKMNENLLRTGDLSLTLEHPTDGDTNIYTCIVSIEEGKVLMEKQINLRVKVPQVVEVDAEKESVLLPCRSTVTLTGDARVEWRDRGGRKVHVYENGSDHPKEQDKRYINRTKMNEDLLRTGDLSLTLKYPTDRDTNIYTCIVTRGKRNILMKKQVDLQVKVHQVEVEKGAVSVLLPFTTTSGLPGEAGVFWWDKDSSRVHLFENGSDQDKDQNHLYRNRTEMKKGALTTGDLSLILMCPTEDDSGEYKCEVRKRGELWRAKNIHLTVKAGRVQDQNQPEDISTRNGSTEMAPLMGEQSV